MRSRGLPPFSPRARSLLAGATRREVERDPEVIAGRLRGVGRPVWPSVVELQQTYGGLVWQRGNDRDELGIYFRPPEDGEDENDFTMVPVGTDGVCTIYM